MLGMGIIEQATTPYINPMVVVPKKDGNIRSCLDGRQLNSNLQDHHDGPEDIDDILRNSTGGTIISSIDLTKSFWQISLAPESHQ